MYSAVLMMVMVSGQEVPSGPLGLFSPRGGCNGMAMASGGCNGMSARFHATIRGGCNGSMQNRAGCNGVFMVAAMPAPPPAPQVVMATPPVVKKTTTTTTAVSETPACVATAPMLVERPKVTIHRRSPLRTYLANRQPLLAGGCGS